MYNAVCVALAAYVVVGVVQYKLARPGSFACNEPDLSPAGQRLSRVLWFYYAQKFLEYGDTLTMVLRKSFRQLTPLHLYHHVSITVVTALFLRYDLNGDTYLPALANSFVHVLMYSHYLLAAFGIDTWWKKQLTSLQLVQFLTVMAQSLVSLARGSSCGFPEWLKVVMVAYQASSAPPSPILHAALRSPPRPLSARPLRHLLRLLLPPTQGGQEAQRRLEEAGMTCRNRARPTLAASAPCSFCYATTHADVYSCVRSLLV